MPTDIASGSKTVDFIGEDGAARNLRKLSPHDLVDVAEEILADRRARLRAHLAEFFPGDKEKHYAELNLFDTRAITRGELIGACDNPAVQIALIRRAISRTRGVVFSTIKTDAAKLAEIDAEIDVIGSEDMHRVCLGLLHVRLRLFNRGGDGNANRAAARRDWRTGEWFGDHVAEFYGEARRIRFRMTLAPGDDPMQWPIDVFRDTEADLMLFDIERKTGTRAPTIKARAEHAQTVANATRRGIPPLFAPMRET